MTTEQDDCLAIDFKYILFGESWLEIPAIKISDFQPTYINMYLVAEAHTVGPFIASTSCSDETTCFLESL